MSIEEKAKLKATATNAKIMTNEKIERLNARDPAKTTPATTAAPQKK